jgi:hypothetical protein
MRSLRILTLVVATTFAAGTAASFAAGTSEESREQTVQMSQVPKAARDAATKALGATPSEAKMISGTSPQEYELQAKASNGKAKAVHVKADGTIVKMENESSHD